MEIKLTVRAEAIAVLKLFASDKDVRYYLNGINLEIGATESRLVATDGSMLGCFRVESEQPEVDAPLTDIIIPNDLLKANCVRLVGYAPHWGRFQEGSKTFKLTVSGNLEFNHIAPAVQACADGAGFGQFLSYQVAPLLQSGALETVLDDFADAPRPIHVVYPHARLLPTRTRAFIDFIRQELKGFEPGNDPP